ncbi:MAG TPA: hypothetical protein VF950_23310 [Planctomycetota bacterium]
MRRAVLPLLLIAVGFSFLLLVRRAPEDVDVPPRPPARAAAPDVDRPPARRTSPPPRLSPRTAFERVVDALRVKDRERAKEALEDLRLAFLPDPVPDAENAALLYKVAFARLEELSEEEADLLGKPLEELTAEERERRRGILAGRPEILDFLRRAAELPRSDFGVKYEDGFMAELPHIAPMILAAKLLRTETELGGNPADARAAIRLSEAVADEPIFVSQLVRGVCHGIAAEAMERAFDGEIPEDLLGALPSTNRLREGMERSLLGEIYAATKLMLDGDASALAALAPGSLKLRSLDDPLAADELAHYGESLREISQLMGRPYWESRDRLKRLEAEPVPEWAQLTHLARPSIVRAAVQQATAEARIGTSRAAAALRRYRDARGDYPQSLESIRDLLPEPPIDPFTGRPYLYRREGAGFVIWSVGEDLLDGGGVSVETDVRFRASK